MTVVLDSWVVLRYLEDTNPAVTRVAELLIDGVAWRWRDLRG